MMEALTSWLVGVLMLMLPPQWTQSSTGCDQVPVINGAAGATTEECKAVWTKDGAELTVIVWRPVVARDGGPMESVEDAKGRLLGKDVVVSRTSSFMGVAQEVLVTSVTLTTPEAHVLIYAKGVSDQDFQAILDGVSLKE